MRSPRQTAEQYPTHPTYVGRPGLSCRPGTASRSISTRDSRPAPPAGRFPAAAPPPSGRADQAARRVRAFRASAQRPNVSTERRPDPASQRARSASLARSGRRPLSTVDPSVRSPLESAAASATGAISASAHPPGRRARAVDMCEWPRTSRGRPARDREQAAAGLSALRGCPRRLWSARWRARYRRRSSTDEGLLVSRFPDTAGSDGGAVSRTCSRTPTRSPACASTALRRRELSRTARRSSNDWSSVRDEAHVPVVRRDRGERRRDMARAAGRQRGSHGLRRYARDRRCGLGRPSAGRRWSESAS